MRTTPTLSGEETPERRALSERESRKREATQRKRCDLLKFWRMCATAQCRRNHACSGDPDACFRRHWSLMPEQEKEWIRGAILAAGQGARG